MTLNPKVLLVCFAILIAGLGLFTVLQPDPLEPVAAIDALIDEGVRALEDGDTGDVMDLVSDSFRGQIRGSQELDRERLSTYLTAQSLRGGIDVRIVSRDIQLVDGVSATATLAVVGTRGGVTGALGGDVDTMGVELRLSLEGGDWKIVEARETSLSDSLL